MNISNASDERDSTRSLAVLRAMIDSVDREILQLLGRRNGYVGEIARYKREHRVPIRDYAREREIVSDRRQRARLNSSRLGIPSQHPTLRTVLALPI